MPIVAPTPRKIKWSNLRKGMKEIIMAAAPNARVHSRWALKYDITSTIDYLLSVNDPENIHAWMLSVETVQPSNPKAGGGEIQYDLNIRIWGFKGFVFGTDASNSQDAFEDEVDDVVAYFHANRLFAFGLSEADGRNALKDVNFLPQFEIEVAAFGEGYDVHVAKAVMALRIVR